MDDRLELTRAVVGGAEAHTAPCVGLRRREGLQHLAPAREGWLGNLNLILRYARKRLLGLFEFELLDARVHAGIECVIF
jgi:hypothetical protein